MTTLRNVVLVALVVGGLDARAEENPKINRVGAAKRMLFVGNSCTYFNDGVPLHVKQLASAADKINAASYAYKMATISGAYLAELTPIVPLLLKSERWDIVVLQGHSQEPMATSREESDRFRVAVRASNQAIRAARATTVLYMTWAYRDKPEMTACSRPGTSQRETSSTRSSCLSDLPSNGQPAKTRGSISTMWTASTRA